MSTHNIGFYEDLTKIIFELSSNIIKYAPYFFCCPKHTPVLLCKKTTSEICRANNPIEWFPVSWKFLTFFSFLSHGNDLHNHSHLNVGPAHRGLEKLMGCTPRIAVQ